MTEDSSIIALLADKSLRFPIVLTLQACGAAFVLFVTTALPLALYTARSKSLLSRAVLFASTLPLIFPPVALGYLLLVLFGTNGVLGRLLMEAAGIRIVFSETAVVISAFIAGLPLVVRPVKIAFESEALLSLEAASRVCGASRLRTFFVVTLPTVRNSVLAALLLGVARASGEVGITMMLGGNIAARTNTLSLEIFNAVGRGDFELATALCLVLAVVALVLYAALEFVRGKTAL